MKKTDYNLIDNLIFVIKNIWNWNKINCILIILQIPLTVLSPYLSIYNMKSIINHLEQKDVYIYWHIVALFSITCIIVGINKYCEKYIEWTLRGYRYMYIESIIKKRMKTDYINIISTEGQELLGRVQNMVNHDEATIQIIMLSLIGICSSLLGGFIYGIIIFKLNNTILFVIIITSLFSFNFSKKIQKYGYSVKKYTWKLDRKMAYITAKSSDLKIAKDIRLFSMSTLFNRLFDIFSNDRMRWHEKVLRKEYIGVIIDGILILIRNSMAYIYLIYQFYLEKIQIGDFTYYLGIITGLSAWITNFLFHYVRLTQMIYDINDLRKYLNMPEVENKQLEKNCLKSIDELELRNVCFRFEENENNVIENINFKVRKGEKIAIVGANGAGKTTLMSLICGLLTPTEGEILLNGVSSEYYEKREIFKNFSTVFQNIGILPLSIRENITFCDVKKDNQEKLNNVIKLAGMDKILSNYRNGIDSLLVKDMNEDAVQLSGGELQKIALARAIYKDCSVMILDEPTASLDPIAEYEIYEKYNLLFADKISFYISHRLASTQFCDKIYLIKDGKIIETGTHEQLLNEKGEYAKLYTIQSKYYKNKTKSVI